MAHCLIACVLIARQERYSIAQTIISLHFVHHQSLSSLVLGPQAKRATQASQTKHDWRKQIESD